MSSTISDLVIGPIDVGTGGPDDCLSPLTILSTGTIEATSGIGAEIQRAVLMNAGSLFNDKSISGGRYSGPTMSPGAY